jgi:hypothetical protein
MNREWLAPLTGVAFIVVLFAGFIVAGEPPQADDPVQEIVDHYVDDDDAIMFGALLQTIAAGFLVFFAAYLRKVFRAAEGEGGVLSAVVLIGATVVAVGASIDATISFALAEAADDIDPSGVQSLQALWDNDFMPLALGTGLFLLASGISTVRHGALPNWLGWIAILLGIVSFTPIGFAGAAGAAVWILIVSVLLALRARPTTPTAAAPPPPPTAPPPAP